MIKDLMFVKRKLENRKGDTLDMSAVKGAGCVTEVVYFVLWFVWLVDLQTFQYTIYSKKNIMFCLRAK